MDEVFILPLAGAFDITVTGAFGLTTQLAATGPVQALYMTPHHGYRLAPCGETVVAYARAEAEGRVPVQAVAAAVSIGLAERLQFHLVDLSFGAALALPEGEVLFHVRDGGLRVETTVGGVVPVTAGQTIALPNDRPVSIRALAPTRVLVLSALGPPKTAV